MSEKVGKIEIVIKGGQPWGFRLQAKAENRSVVIVDEIVQGGRADLQGELRVGDHVIKINGIQCLSLADALQLIDSAFRTLTVVVWRTNNFSNKDKSKDSDAAHQFDQLPSNLLSESHRSLKTASLYENINFAFKEGKQRSRRFSPIENACHYNNKDILPNSVQWPYNYAKVYPETNDNYKSNLKVSLSCLDKTLKTESEKKAVKVYNLEKTAHSKTQRDSHQYSNVQQLPVLNYMHEVNKYEARHFSRASKEIRQYSNVQNVKYPSVNSINEPSYGKIFTISESSGQTLVPSVPVQENNKLAANNSFGHSPASSILTNTKISVESDCCRYPNCHNKYLNCKIHSPPERDVTYPIRPPFKNDENDYENIDFISQADFTPNDQNSCDNVNYGQNEVLNSLPFETKKEVPDSKTFKWEKDSVPLKSCDFQSVNSSNCKLEMSANCIIPKTSDIHAESMNTNSLSSLCHLSNSVSEVNVNSKSKTDDRTCQSVGESDIYHYTSVYGQIRHMSYNVQGKDSTSKSSYSSCSKPPLNKRMFSSLNNASFIKENDVFFDASNNSMCMISKEAAVVKLVSSRPQQIYIDEDDELKEIDENRNQIAVAFSSVSASPPLPSPPPETDTEILPCNEPLPSPPSFISEQKQENNSEMVETIYANLEMLKIHCSVVSSSSQTGSSNEKQPATYSSCSEDITADISSSESASHPVQAGLLEAKPQVGASFIEKVIQNQEEKFFRRVFNLPFNSAYFTTSVPKAKLLTRYTSKLHSNNMSEVKELSNEKEELIASLRKKLDILLEEEAALQDELKQNEELGKSLSNKLESTAKQNELKKFMNHVQELEKITNLLLSLSGRLARTKNALLILPPNASAEEKVLLETKYKKLTQQYEEALHLQKNIDNRNKQVLFYLQKYLTGDELADYNHFIKMKVKLLVDYKELVEKIKLGEEQLKALTNS